MPYINKTSTSNRNKQQRYRERYENWPCGKQNTKTCTIPKYIYVKAHKNTWSTCACKYCASNYYETNVKNVGVSI